MVAVDPRVQDPRVPDWVGQELPEAWADRLGWWGLLRHVLGRRQPVQLPVDMPLPAEMPKYVLLEFHHLPNGNYSKRFTSSYITGFDRSMIGEMRRARTRIAGLLADCKSVLDVGTAGGRTAAMLKQQGVPDVWGIDPSPYLLQHAARSHPGVNFVQSTAEHTPFPNERFEGIAVCFVLHEIPPKYIARCLAEFRRVCKKGGLLVICEPSPAQLQLGWRSVTKHAGWRGAYFKLLAKLVHEPFVRLWHELDARALLATAGFELASDEEHFPARYIVARAV